ncbi:hypothetical protein ACS0TY_014408 [Phlomoides rotata]
MALFCSSLVPPIPCPNLHRNYAIQKPFTTKTSNYQFFKISISAPAKILIKKGDCRSSLSTPVELDDVPPSNVIIFIKGLAKSTVEGGLRTTFSQFGEVTRVKIVTDKKSKQSLGFGYVWFTREEHAQAAINMMNGQFFEGRFIHVTLAKPGSCKTRTKPYKF